MINEYSANFYEIDYRRKLIYECAVKFDLKKTFWFFLVGFFLSSLQLSFINFSLFMWFKGLSNMLRLQRFRFRTNLSDLELRLKIYFKFQPRGECIRCVICKKKIGSCQTHKKQKIKRNLLRCDSDKSYDNFLFCLSRRLIN